MASPIYKKSLGNTYQAHRSFDNTLFQHKKRTHTPKLMFGLLLFLIGCSAAVWLILRPFMFLRVVEVYGAETLDHYTLSTGVLNALEQDTIFGIPSTHIWRKQEGIIEGYLAQYSFATIDTQKKNRVLTIHVTEQAQGGLIHVNRKWALYNLQGHYVRDLTEDEVRYVENTINGITTERNLFFSDTPIIEFANQEIGLTNEHEALMRIKIFHDTLIREGIKPGMHIVSDDQLLWAETRTREGDRILYDVFRDAKEQVEQYMTVKKELGVTDLSTKIFDIRFDGRVFVR